MTPRPNRWYINHGYFKKPIIVRAKPKQSPPPGRDWLLIGTPYLVAHDILAACARHFRITTADICRDSGRRLKAERNPRFSFYYLCRELTELSFPEIGVVIGRDHSTVVHGVDIASRSPEIMEAVSQIKAGLVRIGL